MVPELRLSFATNDFQLASTEMRLVDGSRMRTDFTNSVVNPVLGPGVFLATPAGFQGHRTDVQMSSVEFLLKALTYLPHGPEFRFLDRLTALEPGKSGWCDYSVRGDEPFLRGHFPGQPIFPGVLLVEAAAQLAGIVAQTDPAIPPLAGLKLTAMRNVKIFGTARPGETIFLEATVSGRLGGLVQAHATARLGEITCLTADLTLSGK